MEEKGIRSVEKGDRKWYVYIYIYIGGNEKDSGGKRQNRRHERMKREKGK